MPNSVEKRCAMDKQLKKHTGPAHLVHITTSDRIDNILQKGILASEYGDLPIDGNDGAGIYAIRNDSAAIQTLIANHFFCEDDLYAIHFLHAGEFYECVDEIFSDEEMDNMDDEDIDRIGSHVGYIVIPGVNQCIEPNKITRIERVHGLFFAEERVKDKPASLDAVVQAAEALKEASAAAKGAVERGIEAPAGR